MAQPMRIGEILIERGVLNEQQVFEVLEAQKRLRKPFGVLAESMFDVRVETIEDAWVEQYHRFTGTIDLDEQGFDEEALRLLHRRQAWQFELLPIRFDGSGELLVAAGRDRLARAVSFAAAKLEPVVYFRIAQREQLKRFLQRHYPMPEVSDRWLQRARDSAFDLDPGDDDPAAEGDLRGGSAAA